VRGVGIRAFRAKFDASDKGGESRAGAVFEVEIYDGLFACEIGEVTGVDYEFRTVIQFEEWCSRSKRRYVEHDGFDVVAVDSDYGQRNSAVAAAGGDGCSE
jgi:hypothetical protein